jgi:hypothetical protein
MSEIYKISNRNRHRNKEKKKLREAVVVDVSQSSSQSFDYFSSSKKQKGEGLATSEKEGEGNDQVLREVGWGDALKAQVSKSTSIAQKGTMGHYKSIVNSSAKPQLNPYLVNDVS